MAVSLMVSLCNVFVSDYSNVDTFFVRRITQTVGGRRKAWL